MIRVLHHPSNLHVRNGNTVGRLSTVGSNVGYMSYTESHTGR